MSKILPGDHVGFIIIRTAGPGPEVPDLTIFKSYPAALDALAEVVSRRDAGGFTYGVYIAAITLVTEVIEGEGS